jgi:zinc protease
MGFRIMLTIRAACAAALTGSLFTLAAPSRAAEPNDPALKAAAAFYDGVRTETLPNGLRVFLKPIPGFPVVTTMVAYKAGSADEELDHTGLAHYLEHLMFKGTDKLMPGDIDRLTQRAGGRNNAYTAEDMTVFHFDFAADRWDAALPIEADRMRNLRIDARHEFQQEKGAVVSELEMDEDRPFDLEYKAILPRLFGKATPYGHPVIGERAHVRGATAEVIKSYYDRWYHPNNASLIVVGGFDPDTALARIKELFGPIPAAKLPERKTATPVHRDKPVRTEIPSKFEVPRMIMGFNAVRSGDPDFYALEVVQAVLAGGKTSRLYRKLVEEEAVASAVDASNNAGRFPGWFSVQLEMLKGPPRERGEQLVLAELKRLAAEPVSPEELQRVKRGLIAGTVFTREDTHELADSIARGVTVNDLDYLKGYLPRIAAVSAAEVQAVARKYLDPERRVVVWSVPREGQGAAGADGAARPPRRQNRWADAPGGGGGFDVKATQRVVLPNGLTLLLLENHRLPIIVAEAFVKNTRMTEPADKAGVAHLVGEMLDEGTAARSGSQIATAIEDVGGVLSLNAAGGSVRVLAPDRSLGFDLLFDCLTHPNFPKDALERKRAQTLSAIIDSEQRAEVRAQRAFQQMVYGPGHPLSRPSIGLKETVAKLTADDLRAFHAARFVPNNTVVAVVGDFSAPEVIAEITRLTKDWKSAEPPKPEPPPVEKPAKFTQKITPMPESAQLYVLMGHLGIRRDNPDYYKLLVMDYVLGTGSGFTDRLSSQLRDRQGLAYAVSASITGSAGEQPGTFTCSIGTFPDKFAAVKDGILQELNRIRSAPATAEEVEDAKKYLLGSLPFRYTTSSAVASLLLQIERFRLGFDHLDNFRAKVAAVTPAEVLEVARKYIDPEHLALSAAGPVSPEGKPLLREKGGAGNAPR